MKRLILRLLVALLTFVFSLAVTWVTAYFSEEPSRNQSKAIRHLQDIGIAQLRYYATKGKGDYTDLETLGREGLIDKELVSGEKDGYIFITKPFPKSKTFPSMFDLVAIPRSPLMENPSFYSNELHLIYQNKDFLPPMATVYDRVPKNGFPISQ